MPLLNKSKAAFNASATGSNLGKDVGNFGPTAFPSSDLFDGSLSHAAFQETKVGYSLDLYSPNPLQAKPSKNTKHNNKAIDLGF